MSKIQLNFDLDIHAERENFYGMITNLNKNAFIGKLRGLLVDYNIKSTGKPDTEELITCLTCDIEDLIVEMGEEC